MRLTVIGCSGSFPGPESPASCYLIEHEGTSIVMELGSGALGALARHTDLAAVDAILISHTHIDHCADVGAMYVARRYQPGGALPQIPLIGPQGIGDRMVALYGDTSRSAMGETYAFSHHSPDPVRIGPFTITVSPMTHPIPSFAMRVEAGSSSLCFSADTGPNDALVRLAQGVDLALFEASFLEGGEPLADLHLTAAEAAQLATRAGAGRLVLTHLVPWNDRMASEAEAAPHFAGELQLASSGLVIDL